MKISNIKHNSFNYSIQVHENKLRHSLPDTINENKNIQHNYKPSFGSKFYLKILDKLRFAQNNPNIVTPSHFKNEFYFTNINEVLRNPKSALVDTANLIASKINGRFSSFLFIGSNKNPIKESPLKIKDKMNKEFMQLKGLAQDIKLYRGICNITDHQYQKLKNLKVGDQTIVDKGFAYFSNIKKEAEMYLEPSIQKNGYNKVLFHIECTKGSKMSILKGNVYNELNSHIPIEHKNEYVAPAGLLYQVSKNSEVDKSGVLHVYLKNLNIF